MARWPWQRKQQSERGRERKSMVLGTSEALGSFLMFGEGSASNPGSASRLYETSTAVSIPINIVTDAFSVVNPVLMLGQEMVLEHEVLDLIRRPSAHYTQELFLEVLSKNYLITGETPIIALGNIGHPPLEIQPLSPKSLTPVRGVMGDAPTSWTVAGNTLTGIYEAKPVGKEIRYFDGNLRELKVIRNYSTRDNSLLRGQSLLVSAAKQARQDVLGTEHNVQLLERGGRVSMVFHFDEDVQGDDFEKLKERVRAQFGGASQAGEIGITTGGKMDIKDLGVAPKDMDYGGLQATAQKAVALVYRVPLPLITDQRQTLNNYREGKLALYDDAVIPLARRVLGGLGDFLLPRFGIDPTKARLAMNPDDVTALVQRRNDELLKRKQIGVETIDEFRALLGREKLSEGGDILYQPATLVPIGTDLFTDDNRPELQEDEATGSARSDE